jgi:hypothetical protein
MKDVFITMPNFRNETDQEFSEEKVAGKGGFII